MASVIENPPASARYTGDMGLIPGSGRSPEKEIILHYSILSWKIPWAEDLKSMESQRVRHD